MRTQRSAAYPGCAATVLAAEGDGRSLEPTSWGIRDAVIALSATLGLSLFVGAVLVAWSPSDSGVTLLLAATIPWLAMIGWPLWATSRFGNGARIDLGLRRNWRDLAIGVLGGGLALALGTAATYLTELLIGEFNSVAGDAATDVANQGGTWQLWAFAAVALFGAPFAEELAFRGMLWAGFRRVGLGAFVTGTLVTLVFALFHFEPTRILVLVVVGATFAAARYFSGTLGAPMVAHAINNLPGAIAIATLG